MGQQELAETLEVLAIDYVAQYPSCHLRLGLIGAENVGTQFNYLQALSRFYSAAVLSGLPRLDGGVTSLIQKRAGHWSVTGECVLIRGPEQIRAVRPDYVFPISDPYDQEMIRRFLFAFPQWDTQQGVWDNRVISSTRATMIDYETDTRRTFRSVRDTGPVTWPTAPGVSKRTLGKLYGSRAVSLPMWQWRPK